MEISIKNAQSSINGSHRKENKFYRSYKVGYTKFLGTLQFTPVLDVRVYWTETTCYVCLWYSYNGIYTSASAKAGGYGYCKESSAVDSALREIISGYESFGGVGLTSIAPALMTVCKALTGQDDLFLVESYG